LNNSKLRTEKPTDGSSAEPLRSIPVDANRIDSRDLFIGTREITIRHGGETYRLRLTAQNKLILTK
jgi:hemin uptake protein HemP